MTELWLRCASIHSPWGCNYVTGSKLSRELGRSKVPLEFQVPFISHPFITYTCFNYLLYSKLICVLPQFSHDLLFSLLSSIHSEGIVVNTYTITLRMTSGGAISWYVTSHKILSNNNVMSKSTTTLDSRL